MKRIIALLLAFSLLLSGCGFFGERIKEPVTFYYLCGKYQEDLCCVIRSEEREASGHRGDLHYLLALYRMGPTDDELVSPLKPGVGLNAVVDDGKITLEMLGLGSSMTDIEFTLACSCLTLTCLEITEAEQITIVNGDRTKTMGREDLTLYDITAETTPTEEPQ